ncbi:MAG: hypothetical protein LBG17_05145, partial [Bacteroidales bacterium]|nr:hypothetical protein [Bacteroidales bacterium]
RCGCVSGLLTFIPAKDAEQAQDDLNRFLLTHRKTNIEKHFVLDGENSGYAFVVTYEDITSVGMNTTPAAFASKVEQNAENTAADSEGKKTNEEIVIMVILPNINAAEINERPGFIAQERRDKYLSSGTGTGTTDSANVIKRA